MQVTDYLGQYASTLANAAAGTASSAGAAPPGNVATQNLVSKLTELQAGTVFEGSINSIDGTKILLGLGNGQTISARLDAGMNFTLGQSVFFQVKSNDGSTIAIKPYADGQAFNPTIQKALDAAGMEMTKDTIDMVNRMMQEGMPIDKHSLAAMRQALVQNPQLSMQTAVMMSRLGIPVNDQMAAQFENYLNDRHEMLGQMEQVMDALPSVYAKAYAGTADLLQLNQQILTILNAGGEAVPDQGQVQDQQVPDQGQVQDQQVPDQGQQAGQLNTNTVQPEQVKQPVVLFHEPDQAVTQPQAEQHDPKAGQVQPEAAKDAQAEEPAKLSQLLNRHHISELENQLKELFPKAGQLKLNTQLTAKEFLEELSRQLLEQHKSSGFDKSALNKLFSGREYHTLLKDVMEQEWTVKPQDLKTEHKIEELYQKLDRQMSQIEQLARQTGMDTSQLSQSASQVRDNIEFMHQINQAYTYVQIPLKLANQNAHSDLYVYTNKRSLRKREGELSAFLHLELENLGTTDVSVKMLDKNVTTKFYLEDDAAYDLIEANLPKLQERIMKLGYTCSIGIEKREEKVDFVKDFLQKGQPSKAAAKGMVQRYSFDVRA
ncbi:MAG: flagellar hook-length control protein FliK [Eubacterium sp.]|nr:flagellar hook-length control protein FliK [Eubacterium sp.]MCI8917523.1 flagellar hook-length control protein FliK [Eubacterium sp.]